MEGNMKRTIVYALCAMALACGGNALAARPNISHQDIVIEEGQTFNGDIAGDKSITVKGVLNGDVSAIGDAPVTVSGKVSGDVSAVGGPVNVSGAVSGDVSNVGGPVEITGRVGGNISSLGGKVTLSGNGEVDGDISTLGGTVLQQDKAVLKGRTNAFDTGTLRRALASALRSRDYEHHNFTDDEAGKWLLGGLAGIAVLALFSALVTGVILMLLPPVFFPKNVETAVGALRGDLWRCCGIGAVILVAFFPCLLLMLVSILGIPLIPFGLMLFAAAGLLGLAAFGVVLQDRFFVGIKRRGPQGLLGKVAVGYGLTAGLFFLGHLVPLIGGILSLIGLMLGCFGGMVGLGAAWTTRMGSRPAPVPPAVPAQPAPAQAQPPAQQ